MISSEFWFWPISKLAAAYRARNLSPVEVTEAMLGRIENLNPALNAFIELTAERARAAARRAEEELGRHLDRGPLQGVPVAVKDLFFMRGVHARAGSRLYRDFIPDFDATAVERLEAAGAVILGRAHMHELAFGVTNVNPHYGDCHNPWDLACVPGGSSGGSAAAVAAGLAYAALGTDTGGSIRIPASFCGVTGFKPTYGRISRHGVIPLSWQLDHVGTFARSAEDSVIAAQALAGGDPMDASCLVGPAPLWVEQIDERPRDWNLGVAGPPLVSRLDPEVSSAMDQAVHVLRQAGMIVEQVEIPDAIEAGELAHVQVQVEGAAVLDQGYRKDPTQFGDDVRAQIEQGRFVSAVDYLHAMRYRRVFQRRLDRMFDTYRALLLPATPMPAPGIQDSTVTIGGVEESVGTAATRLVRQFNFAGVPVLTVPCGFSSRGLPIGMQIVTRAGDELSGLQLGHLYQELTGFHRAAPEL
jgi:aspartyl-tRNA(Asn)/glutamyl-tRNA(Gln) amidotransferase subunit A